jgi:hypothetical protein
MSRVWQFVLPGSGEHIVKAEKIGTCMQKVFLDGAELESREGQTVFSGPNGAILRLKHTPGLRRVWALLVDERQVEEVGKSGDGLRDLRSMAEGSYTIATGFSAAGLIKRKNMQRKFRFRVAGVAHTVIVAHHDRTWQVAFDTEMVDQEKHSILDSAVEVEFTIPGPDASSLLARLEIVWNMMTLSWTYCLHIGDIRVPVCWMKTRGHLRKVKAPEVFPGWLTVSNNSPIVFTEEEEAEEEENVMDEDEISTELEEPGRQNVDLDSLPQGVSHDRESDAFQANIRDPKSGRFIFLGEFASPDRAHQKYLEALSRYNPDKAIAPPLA